MTSLSKAIYGIAMGLHGAILALWLTALALGREVAWHYPLATAMVLCLSSTAALVQMFRKPQEKGAAGAALAILLLSSVMLLPLASGANSWVLCVNIAVAIAASMRVMRPKAAKVMIGVVFSLALSVVVLALSVASAFIGLREIEVVSEIESPDGRYTAQVVAISSGALGGDTQVVVHETATQIQLGVCTVEKPADVLTFLETYRSHELVEIAWEDADTLRVTGDLEVDIDTTYDIAFE